MWLRAVIELCCGFSQDLYHVLLRRCSESDLKEIIFYVIHSLEVIHRDTSMTDAPQKGLIIK